MYQHGTCGLGIVVTITDTDRAASVPVLPGMGWGGGRLSPACVGVGRELSRSTLDVVTPMPEPGDISPGFIAEAGRCWRMVYDNSFQATHCAETPRCTGR